MNLTATKHLIVIVVLLLTACASTVRNEKVSLAGGVFYTLSQPPKELLLKSHTHLIEAQFDGQTKRFIAQVEYANKQISLAAVTVSGLPLFDFIWQSEKPIVVNQYVPMLGLDIKNIIADLQWINWPIDILRSSVSSKSENSEDQIANLLNIEEKITEQSGNQQNWLRTLKQNGKLILTIEKHGNEYHLKHMLRKYSLKITDISKDIT